MGGISSSGQEKIDHGTVLSPGNAPSKVNIVDAAPKMFEYPDGTIAPITDDRSVLGVGIPLVPNQSVVASTKERYGGVNGQFQIPAGGQEKSPPVERELLLL